MTDDDIQQLRTDAAGFRGVFEFQPEHTEDRGLGLVADFVELQARLIYVADDRDYEDAYEIAAPTERHVAEPIARMLNGVPALLDEIDRLRAERDAMRLTDVERDALSRLRNDLDGIGLAFDGRGLAVIDRLLDAETSDATRPAEGTPAWRAGIEASIRKVNYRLSVMPDLMVPAYRQALLDVKLHLDAMLERNTERSTCTVDEGSP